MRRTPPFGWGTTEMWSRVIGGLEGLSEAAADRRFATGVGVLRATAPAVAAGDSVPERAGRFALGLHQFKRAIASLI